MLSPNLSVFVPFNCFSALQRYVNICKVPRAMCQHQNRMKKNFGMTSFTHRCRANKEKHKILLVLVLLALLASRNFSFRFNLSFLVNWLKCYCFVPKAVIIHSRDSMEWPNREMSGWHDSFLQVAMEDRLVGPWWPAPPSARGLGLTEWQSVPHALCAVLSSALCYKSTFRVARDR